MAGILITGASSGIGAALAYEYASRSSRLLLWGRNPGRLEATAERCRARGAEVVTECFDLTDFDRLVAALEAADARAPLDLAILNAGLGGIPPRGEAAENPLAARAMAGVNFTAPVIAANWLAARMAQRGGGRIVLVGSVAGNFPLPIAPVYAGTKAGLAMFAEALRLRLSPFHVGVTLVVPGFVDTPMSRSVTEPKPFVIDAEKAARIIARKIARGARRVVFPWQFAVVCGITGLLPDILVRAVLQRLARHTDIAST